jgi:predicted metal-binding membrane protein
MENTRMERLLDRTTLAALTIAATGAWIVTASTEDAMDFGPAPFLGSWTAMMAAMMLPSAAPLVLIYRRGASGSRTAALVAGYLLVWAALGVVAYAYMRSEVMAPAWAVLGLAGLYQLTPLKVACLRRCRTPVGFLVARFGREPFRIGLEHGAWCAGCCWALMVVLVAAGSMELAWAAVIAAVVLLEKLAPYGLVFARVTGIALLALAVTEGGFGWPGI